MGLLKRIGRTFSWAGRRVAMRSRWLARRLWVIAAADVALVTRRHWKRLDASERERLLAITRKWKGRNSNLTAKERREAEQLLDKLGHIELAGTAAGIVLPFRPLSRLATMIVERRSAAKRREQPSAA